MLLDLELLQAAGTGLALQLFLNRVKPHVLCLDSMPMAFCK